jgi:di/tricarboxylate transporter
MLIVFAALVGIAVLFASNRVRNDMAALAALLALQLSGVLTIPESLAGFADPVVLVLISMFIISEALVHTGVAQQIGSAVLKVGRGSETRLIAALMVAVGVVGAFMNSTTAMAIFIPVAFSVVREADINRKRLMMPLSVAALISGMMTLIATAPNLVVDKALRAEGLESFSFFSFTPFGVATLVVGVVFMLVAGRRMLAKERQGEKRKRGPTLYELIARYGLAEQIHRLGVPPDSPWVERAVARIQMRQHYGVHIIAFEKDSSGKRHIAGASPGAVFESGDEILVVGDREQVQRMAESNRLVMLPLGLPYPARKRQEFMREVGLAEIILVPGSKMIGKSLKDVQFRSRYNATVVAMHRRGTALTKEVTEVPLDFGDALLVNASWRDILSLRDERDNFVVLTLPEEFQDITPAHKRSRMAIAILVAMVVAMALRLLPTVTAAMLAALALIATRCVNLGSVYRVINWQAVVLIAAILPFATALEKSGASQLIATGMVNTLGGLGTHAMLGVVFLVTAATGFFISNTATAVLIAPIAIDAAQAIGVSPHAFAMTVAIACSAAYVTPVSSPVNMLVLEPGGYKFADFVKVGLPLLLLTLIVTVALTEVFYIY